MEEICDRAGYTRGAFYSNFESLDELFVTLYEDRSAFLVRNLEEALDVESLTDELTLDRGIELLVNAFPVDQHWYLVHVEFVAWAARNPEFSPVLADHERRLLDATMPVISAALASSQRRIRDVDGLRRAISVLHQGLLLNVLQGLSIDEVRSMRRSMVRVTIESYVEPTPGSD